MKTKWMFIYECRGMRFGRSRNYRRAPMPPQPSAATQGLPIPDFVMSVVPDGSPKLPGAEETGQLRIVLAGPPDDTKALAFHIAVSMARQFSFSVGGQVKIHGGLITGERIPESAEESAAVSDEPYFVEVHLEEYIEPPEVSTGQLTAIIGDQRITRLIDVYNAALETNNPVNKFLDLFRVLEDVYCTSRKTSKTVNELQRSRRLYDMGYEHLTVQRGNRREKPTRQDFNELLEDLVKARTHSAHLRSSAGLGVGPKDPLTKSLVEPLLFSLQILAFRTITVLVDEQDDTGSGPSEDRANP